MLALCFRITVLHKDGQGDEESPEVELSCIQAVMSAWDTEIDHHHV